MSPVLLLSAFGAGMALTAAAFTPFLRRVNLFTGIANLVLIVAAIAKGAA